MPFSQDGMHNDHRPMETTKMAQTSISIHHPESITAAVQAFRDPRFPFVSLSLTFVGRQGDESEITFTGDMSDLDRFTRIADAFNAKADVEAAQRIAAE